ncbi:YggL 50S ribosome-binding family protein [Stutzerimonas azotifigens]|uniref:YggL 50S ribosome-binding family protein n=1 Tax=Stutzerimonas azotifigens TaxID=291995 RepID=UPI0005B8C1DD|nr:50S ribosome-binding protein YggL [Stutzerimonas azotifigens]
MAIRSRRLRKKLCVDEFQELGCELTLTYREGLDSEAVNACFRAFLAEAIEGNGLGYVGGEDYGFICLARRGSVTEEQRQRVQQWLEGRPELAEFQLSPLIDVWYPQTPVRAQA